MRKKEKYFDTLADLCNEQQEYKESFQNSVDRMTKKEDEAGISVFVNCETCNYFTYLGYCEGELITRCWLGLKEEHNAGKTNGGWTKCDYYKKEVVF